MKAQRRHELKENDLRHWLIENWNSVRRHANQVLGAAVVAILVLGLIGYWRVVAAQSQADDWQVFFDLRMKSSDEPNLLASIQQLVERANTPAVERMSLLLLAETAWEQAVKATEPDAGKLLEAEQAYQRIVTEHADAPFAVGSAYRGLAAIAEVRHDGKKAREYYEKILADDRLKGAPVRSVAEARLVDLDARMVPIKLAPAPTTRPVTTRKVATRPRKPRPGTTQPAKPRATTQPVRTTAPASQPNP